MKKFYCFALLLPCFLACNGLGKESQEISCEITSPADGYVHDLYNNGLEIIITGDAVVADGGEITKVELKVDGKVIESVTAVPVNYKHLFASDQATGDVAIELSVEGDRGGKSSTHVTVKLERSHEIPPVEEDEFRDERDNRIYKTVRIGNQTWFAENLAYLPQVSDPAKTAETCTGQMYYYVLNYKGEDTAAAKETAEYKKYGVLYNWYAAAGAENAEAVSYDAPKGSKGVCPSGWHVPSVSEWRTLSDYVAEQLPPVKGNGNYVDLGDPILFPPYWEFEEGLKNVWSALAGPEGWGESAMKDENPDLANGPRNTFGFNVIPAGQTYHRPDYQGNMFKFSDSGTSFWTNHVGEQGALALSFSNMNYNLNFPEQKYGSQYAIGHAVRCIQD